jgi:hypothetical protein
VEWENPPTTLWIEAKYLSGLAEGTTHSEQNDQVIRGIRTLLGTTGNIQTNCLFELPRRVPIWLALLNAKPDRLVEHYRDRRKLTKGLKGITSTKSLPGGPFVGTITWLDIAKVLEARTTRMTATEKSVSKAICEYIRFKASIVTGSRRADEPQGGLLIPPL